MKDSRTRPGEALQDLDRSSDLNDDRAVYRSRLLLDQDLAARNASQATVYNEIGFHQLGLEEAAQSLAVDPGSASAHRFLADIYATAPRYDIARASELLQAQLRQPLGAPPLQAQLANDVAFKNTFFGPATVGLNEFSPLFLQNGKDLQLFGLLGNDSTYGNQAIFNGLHGPVSFSLSEFATHSDGYRSNNDDTQRQYDGFAQAQFGDSTSAQVEITHTKEESGDQQSTFDPTLFSATLRNEVDIDTQRLGMRRLVDANSDILLSVIRQDREGAANYNDPAFPLSLVEHQKTWKAEAQYLTRHAGFDVILGASYFRGDGERVTTFFDTSVAEFNSRHVNAYGYLAIPTRAGWPQVQLGASYDDLTSEVGDQSELNPKIGVIWKIAQSITLRAAGFRVLKRRINSDQGLEPTQLAGFSQFFDDLNGTISEGGGLAANFVLSPTVTGGLQLTRRDLTLPPPDLFTGEVFFARQTEKVAAGYLYWLASQRMSVSLEPRYQDFTNGLTFQTLKLTEVPLAVRFYSPSGLWMGASVTGVRQQGEFTDSSGVDVGGSDHFWVVDAIVAYRLPGRLGTINIQGTNLFNEKFQFQEIDPMLLPRYIPESQVLLRMSLSF